MNSDAIANALQQTMDFFNAAAGVFNELLTIAHENPDVWQKNAIMSPLGELVVIEVVSAANTVYRVNGDAKICLHWNGMNGVMNDIMRAAGYVRK